MTANCGGCQGLGNHKVTCPRHPDWTVYVRPARLAEEIGDTIGANDPGLANRAYELASRIKARHRQELDNRASRTLYDVALKVTDDVLGPGTYAELNGGSPDPGVQAAIEKDECEPSEE